MEGRKVDWYQTVLVDLAGLAARVGKPWRGRIARAVIAAAAEPGYIYARSGGMLSPMRHAGADALAVLAPLLDREQLHDARQAVASQATWGQSANHESAYGTALKALTERHEVLDKATTD